jgi:hypothetical protein
MPLSVSEAAMPPVDVVVEKYTDSHYLIRAGGKILVHGLEVKSEVWQFVAAVKLGIEAAGRRSMTHGIEVLQ